MPAVSRGQLVILAIVLLAAAMGGFAVWWRHWQGRRSQAFWGTQAAQLIRHARRVEALRLAPAAEHRADLVEQLSIGDRQLDVLRSVDISELRGLLHARHSLIVDQSFQWVLDAAGPQAAWKYGLRFCEGDACVVVLLDFDSGRVRSLRRSQQAQLVPRILDGLRRYTVDPLKDAAGEGREPLREAS